MKRLCLCECVPLVWLVCVCVSVYRIRTTRCAYLHHEIAISFSSTKPGLIIFKRSWKYRGSHLSGIHHLRVRQIDLDPCYAIPSMVLSKSACKSVCKSRTSTEMNKLPLSVILSALMGRRGVSSNTVVKSKVRHVTTSVPAPTPIAKAGVLAG